MRVDPARVGGAVAHRQRGRLTALLAIRYRGSGIAPDGLLIVQAVCRSGIVSDSVQLAGGFPFALVPNHRERFIREGINGPSGTMPDLRRVTTQFEPEERRWPHKLRAWISCRDVLDACALCPSPLTLFAGE